MTVKNDKILKAFDAPTVAGKLVTLNEEQASQFIDNFVNESKILPLARVVKMSKPIKDIARLLDGGAFLKPSKGRSSDEVASTDFGSEMLQLISKEVTGNIMIYDQDIQDNIEGTNITTKLLSILNKKIANELEVAWILGIQKLQQNSLVDMFDGFRKRVADDGHVVDANSSSLFSGAQRTIVKDKFTRAFKAMPTKYRAWNLKFFAGSDTLIDYNATFDANYNRADFVNGVLGKEILEVPLMPIDSPVPTATASTTTDGTLSDKGQKVLNVTASTNFASGQTIIIGLGTKYQMVKTVDSVDTGTITVTENLDQAIPADLATALTVSTSTLDGTDVLLTDPLNLIYGIQTEGMSFETYRVPNKGYQYFFKMRLDFQVENPDAAVLLKNLKNT